LKLSKGQKARGKKTKAMGSDKFPLRGSVLKQKLLTA